ncbi:MAG: undecaprenyldiphospho-muramoylpentapeptide beta-N-acetylglucosaminyltransferase [Anaerolineales bacterium]|nr:undecaprenyldiphospho-muramoylpentapeptide beta-N-acetylglucosaminyltransferase [Anaerolineales bacterium]MBS3752557.1 undecaprenyldiphospho-muramoylpentapeptide beta-N-acetylglucosaminyltransferase [Anaerolineales bacterium]
MRLLICAGGTGGGVYPALAVLQSLKDDNTYDTSLEDVLWVGGERGMEKEIVERNGIRFRGIPAAGLHGVGMKALPGNLLQLVRGFFEARDILRSFRPHAMLFTGGYVAAPVALAGRSVPSVLYVPDIEPGLALKSLARFADAIAVTTEDTRKYFPMEKKVHVTGYPVRSNLKRWNRERAFHTLELSPQDLVLLVFGGSKGARSINRALMKNLPDLLEDVQIVHISGHLDWQEIKQGREALSPELKERYRAFPYLHERMGAAYTAADLTLSRAGASILGEFPSFGLPAVLVPYPHAWRYQKVNAQYLVDQGAAVIIEDESLTEELLPTVRDLLEDREKREQMSENMSDFARPRAAESIGLLIKEVGKEKGDRK